MAGLLKAIPLDKFSGGAVEYLLVHQHAATACTVRETLRDFLESLSGFFYALAQTSTKLENMNTSTKTQMFARAATLALVSARLSRLVTQDTIGKWLIHEPVDKAMDGYYARKEEEAKKDGKSPSEPWWWRYRQGLDCPWCVGFWLALGTTATEWATRNPKSQAGKSLRTCLEVVGGALALNYVAATLEIMHPANQDSEDTSDDD